MTRHATLRAGTATLALLVAALAPGKASATLVHSGDSTIQGGLCVGFDCSSNEPMGFATIKIEENNLRIGAADSSSVSGFPTTDWQIEFNSSSSGGGSYFMIRDCGSSGVAGSVDSTCGGTAMLTIEGGADNESIHVDSSGNQGGNVGFGTANPVVDLHALSGNTPTLRLEQDNSSGFTPQSWDMAGNESNFFIRDVTNGSALPFRIEPGTASNTLYLDNQERIGIGTSAPDATVEVTGTAGTSQILVDENSGSVSNTRILLQLENNGSSQLALVNSNDSTDWRVQNFSDELRLTKAGTGQSEFQMTSAGDVTIAGTLTENSDKNNKMAIEPVDADAVLAKVVALPVATWTYKRDAAAGIRHIGPMAQDFHAAFGVGKSETGISTLDSSGVALAAIQALSARLEAQDAEIAELKALLEAR